MRQYEHLEEILSRELGAEPACYIDLGFIELIRGNHKSAAPLLEESLCVLRGSQDKFCLAYGIFFWQR